MGRQIVSTSKAAKPPATYSQAVKAAGLVFVSGTAPADPVTGNLVGETIQEQTRQCLTNIAAILLEAGSSLDKIVSATVILAEEEDFGGMLFAAALSAPAAPWVLWLFPASIPEAGFARALLWPALVALGGILGWLGGIATVRAGRRTTSKERTA